MIYTQIIKNEILNRKIWRSIIRGGQLLNIVEYWFLVIMIDQDPSLNSEGYVP